MLQKFFQKYHFETILFNKKFSSQNYPINCCYIIVDMNYMHNVVDQNEIIINESISKSFHFFLSSIIPLDSADSLKNSVSIDPVCVKYF